jgi:hypothetical protein
MGRDTWRFAQHEREREAKRRLNPVWRGVGCVLLAALAVAGSRRQVVPSAERRAEPGRICRR